MATKSSEEQRKAAMAAVWDSVIRRSNVKKDVEKALADADMGNGNGNDKSKAGIASTTRVKPATQTRPTVSVAPADADRPEQKKKFALTSKMILGLVIGAIAVVLIAVLAVIWHNHEVYLATPAGQANAIYNTKVTDSKKLDEAFGDNDYDWYNSLLDGSYGLFNSGSATTKDEINEIYSRLPKWSTDDVAKAQYCLIYASKMSDLNQGYRVYSMMLAQREHKGVDVYPKNLPLTSRKTDELIKKLIKDGNKD